MHPFWGHVIHGQDRVVSTTAMRLEACLNALDAPMKTLSHLICILTLLTLFSPCGALQGSTTAPFFAGNTLTLHGETYTWVSPATEDATWHTDTYTSAASHSVTVKGHVWDANMAIVIGTSGQGAVDGHVNAGTYKDNYQDFSGAGTWELQGETFTHRDMETVYAVDFYNSFVSSTGHDIYTSSTATLTQTFNAYISTSTLVRNHSPVSGLTQIQVFGNTYNLATNTKVLAMGDGYYEQTQKDRYTSQDGGTLTLTMADVNWDNSYVLQSLEVWDPHVGTTSIAFPATLSSTMSGVTWKTRTSPTFAGQVLLRNGTLYVYWSGSITSSGAVIDTYRSQAGSTLTFAGQARTFKLGQSEAEISTGGSTIGTLSVAGQPQMTSGTLARAWFNHSAPLFTGNKARLSVTGSTYAFAGGYQDSAGTRADVYVSSSLGLVTIFGTTDTPTQGVVGISLNGTTYSGTYSSGSFSVSGISVTTVNNDVTSFGPPVLWVAGDVFERLPAYVHLYKATAEPSRTASLSGTVGNWTLGGTHASSQTFSGPCPVDPHGVFIVSQTSGGSTPLPVLPSNTDGYLFLAADAPPAGFPPAVLAADGQHWAYLGTAQEDTSPSQSAAYYGNAETATSSTRLLKIRTDGGSASSVVTLTDYSTGVSTTGSYTPATHLFQSSGPGSTFALPVYAVDPNNNYAVWHLVPDIGLPPSFVVNGQPWWYAGTDGAEKALYQGRYTGQQISITPGTGVVALVDPVANSEESDPNAVVSGSFLGERRSIRLADGTAIVSGNADGNAAPVVVDNGHYLHTIASDLDIVGNNLSFGVIPEDASIAGALFSFSMDSGGVATLKNVLSKPQSRWEWRHTKDDSAVATFKAMTLDETHKLTLYDHPSLPTETQSGGVVLDPAPGGVSTIRGVLRVRPGGNLDMGDFTAGGEP